MISSLTAVGKDEKVQAVVYVCYVLPITMYQSPEKRPSLLQESSVRLAIK